MFKLSEVRLCPYCLGSLIGANLPWIPNYVKGLTLHNLLQLEEGCEVCDGLIPSTFDELIEKALISLEGLEFNTVKAGVILPPWLIEREDRLRARYNPPHMVSIKLTLIKWADLVLSARTGRDVSKDPDVEVLLDFEMKSVGLRIKPVFVYGRYRKLKRGLSQSRPICPYCGGKGCEKCNWTGRIAEGSVEGAIGEVMKEFFEAEDYVLHASGREDVDARMLGNGRPFVMEVKGPKVRKVDLKRLEEEINRRSSGEVEVISLRYAERSEVRKIKEMSDKIRKRYKARVEVEGGEISQEDLRKLEEFFKERVIYQRTPKRVLWRRADIVRKKKVYWLKARIVDKRHFELEVECDGGLYVKELISGDDGRTTPSVSEVLGRKSFCKELDVLEVVD